MRAKEEPVKPIRIPTLDSEQLTELEEFYRTTREARPRGAAEDACPDGLAGRRAAAGRRGDRRARA